jgi:PilZ domain
MLRFAANVSKNRSFSTQFVNVSETGLAFLISRESAPRIGEFIKVEFPVPGGEQIAWFAKVVRLEELHEPPWWSNKRPQIEAEEIIVGVQFHELPEGHRQAIREHLHDKFHQLLKERRQERFKKIEHFFSVYGWQILLYGASIILTFTILYFLAQPSANYDPVRGAPWGQRFKSDK